MLFATIYNIKYQWWCSEIYIIIILLAKQLRSKWLSDDATDVSPYTTTIIGTRPTQQYYYIGTPTSDLLVVPGHTNTLH